jgi:hypothetical protein
MVITYILGGLGNQMFQYAAARRLAWFLNEPLKLDISGYRHYKLRAYGLNHLNISAELASEEECVWLKGLNPIREKHFHFDPRILKLPSDCYLEGYWQSEKYFSDIEPIIRREFTVRKPPEAENRELAQQIIENQAVSVHIRRGDYAHNPIINSLHGVCSPEYYQKAVEQITKEVENPHFYVFSDDGEWAYHNWVRDFPTAFVMKNGPEEDYEDLRLMSLCKYHIIANSSFSWWGAWLSNFPGKIVYAPRNWFQGYQYDTGDLLPESWIRV